ncbi:hypothetical protein K474DRAFT_1668416 [Panus rudis PR-1116 ss-1]|nr:hypothetical protein K474DRAFT_1668416 [Panus rudis PR-1116 ss-1]
MLFYLIFKLTSVTLAYVYPFYSSYKTLSQRPASEADLERWLMYWSILGFIVTVEQTAEWLLSWIPFYHLFKTSLLIYLALPQTQGSSYLYTQFLQPLFTTHESEIDDTLRKAKGLAYNWVQNLIRNAWKQIAGTLAQQPLSSSSSAPQSNPLDEGGITGEAAMGSVQPPTMQDPLSGPTMLVQTLWRSFGPGIVANGLAFFQQQQQQQQQQQPLAATIEPYDVEEEDGASESSEPSARVVTSRTSSAASIRER